MVTLLMIPAKRDGFTLLEIMISILIFGVVITTVFASYRSVFFSTDKIHDGFDLYGMAGSCLNRMVLDINEAVIALPPEWEKPDVDSDPHPYRVVGDQSNGLGGDFSQLRLASRAHVSLDGTLQEGIAEIVYYVSEDAEGERVLRRADRLYPYEKEEESAADPILCEKVKSLVFTYVDEEGDTHQEWDSESEGDGYATPKGVQILLEVGDAESESFFFDTMVTLPVVREAIEE